MTPKVSSMTSPRSGKPVANQFIIEVNGTSYFQSYRTVIAAVTSRYAIGGVKLDKAWNYSRTTSKYLYRFLNTNRKEIIQNLNTGNWLVADLNS